MVEMTGLDNASLVSFFYKFVLLRKRWTMQVQVLPEIQRAKIAVTKIH